MKKLLQLVKSKMQKKEQQDNLDLYQYCGTYSMDDDCAIAEVTFKNNTLFMTFTEKPDFYEALLPTGGHKFCLASDPDKNTLLRFHEDKAGTIVSLEFLNYTFKKQIST